MASPPSPSSPRRSPHSSPRLPRRERRRAPGAGPCAEEPGLPHDRASGDGTTASPLYAAVWVQRPGPDFLGFHGLDSAQYQAFLVAHQATDAPRCRPPAAAAPTRVSPACSSARLRRLRASQPRRDGSGHRDRHGERHGLEGRDDRRLRQRRRPPLHRGLRAEPGLRGLGLGPRQRSRRAHAALFDGASQSWARPERVAFNDDSSRFVTLGTDSSVGQCLVHHDLARPNTRRCGRGPESAPATTRSTCRARAAAMRGASPRSSPRATSPTRGNGPRTARTCPSSPPSTTGRAITCRPTRCAVRRSRSSRTTGSSMRRASTGRNPAIPRSSRRASSASRRATSR